MGPPTLAAGAAALPPQGAQFAPWVGPAALMSREPALSPAIVLHVAEAPAPRRRQAEVELLHVLVVRKVGRVAVHDDATVLQDVAVVRMAQRDHRILLGEQE